MNICKVSKNFYFISGGYDASNYEVKDSCYFYDTSNYKLEPLPKCPEKVYDFFMIYRNNQVLALGGRKDPNNHTEIFSYFFCYDIKSC